MTYQDNGIDKGAVHLLNTAQREIVDNYRDVVASRTTGPQLEGLEEEWLAGALSDPSTLTIELGSGKQWPLLVRVEHNIDYRAQFFVDHFPDEAAYYLSLPPPQDIDQLVVNEQLRAIVEEIISHNGIVTYDYQEGAGDDTTIPDLLSQASGYNFVDVTPNSEAYGQTYGLPTVSHYEAVARQKNPHPESETEDITTAFKQLIEGGEYVNNLTEGPTLLTKRMLTANSELLDNIWTMYEDQFSELVDDHPSLQIQPREELNRMLLDEDSFNVGFMEDGKLVGLCYFVSNIEKCVWLNSKFFNTLHAKDPDTKLVYFPGIVVDKNKARKGAEYATSMLRLVERLIEKAGIDIQIVFQCTNISSTYIPHIVTDFINSGESLEFTRPPDAEGSAFRKTAQYNYRVVRPV